MTERSMRDISPHMNKGFPVLHKKGIVSPYGEMTPFVFRGKLYRLESVDPFHCTRPQESRHLSHAIIRDVESGNIISKLGIGDYFFDAFVDGEKVYVFGTLNNSIYGWFGGDTINVYESTDLLHWEKRVLFQKKDWLFFNHSITKDDEGYVMTVEVSKPVEVAGPHPFTFIFIRTKNLVDLEFMDFKTTAYPMNRYSGGSKLNYFNKWYYFSTLVELPGFVYCFYITRTQDFENWYFGKYNPFLCVTNEDMKVAENAADITDEMRKEIPTGYYSSASDADYCEYNGKTIIDYAVGNQLGFHFIAEAEYDGTLQEMLENFFD